MHGDCLQGPADCQQDSVRESSGEISTTSPLRARALSNAAARHSVSVPQARGKPVCVVLHWTQKTPKKLQKKNWE